VGLGAWCDLDSPAEDAGGSHFKVREFALLSDGREVTLLDDRGWTISAPLARVSVTHIVSGTYTTVLPDNAEETGEEH